MSENIQIYIDKLKKYGECSIANAEWNPTFENDLRTQLKAQGIDDIRVYQAIEQPEFKLICLIFHKPSMEIVQEYPFRSNLIKWLPLFSVILIYFFLIGLLALDQEKMLTTAFLIFLPLSIGAVTEYFWTLRQPQALKKTLLQQFYIVLGVIVVGAVFLREGVICLIMAAPIYWLCATLGALAMRALCRKLWKPYKKIYSIALLPLVALLFFPDLTQIRNGVTQKEIIVNAPIQTVFASINNIQNIQPEEIKYSPIFTMGFPKPVSGMTESTPNGLVRQIYWQRGIHFQEKIFQSEAPNKLAWHYVFTDESFPKGSLDDHLKMGGAYFNLLTTDYQLQALSPTQTKMILRIDYRLSTEVNWYADLWTRYVLKEFSDVVLNIYKYRLEHAT